LLNLYREIPGTEKEKKRGLELIRGRRGKNLLKLTHLPKRWSRKIQIPTTKLSYVRSVPQNPQTPH